MRRTIVFVLSLLGLLVALPQAASAQGFGLLGGVTFAEISGSDADEDLDRTTGFLVGGFARVPLGQIITFQPEVQYVRKGAERQVAGSDYAVKLSYIDVPMFLSFGFPGSFHAMAAPTFSFEVGCQVDADTPLGEFEGDCDDADNEFDRRNSFLVGATVGLGIDFPLGGLALFIDGRYNVDLDSFHEADNVDLKNQAFEIVGGVRFGG